MGSKSQTVSLSDQTIACLDFFHRWETPLDLQAAKVYRRIRTESPDFAAFQRLAPPGGQEREGVQRFFASFEDAGRLLRSGEMREDLFFDSWYALPDAWIRARPYILGLRQESGDPKLYESFEWLSVRAEEFWAERTKNPPVWKPLDSLEPTPEDRAVFETFHRNTWPGPEAWAFFDELAVRAPTYESFVQIIPDGNPDYITFDLILCAYDRAGVLVKNGILHPTLLYGIWRSPADIWKISRPWVRGIQKRNHSTHIYENVEWLSDFESPSLAMRKQA